MDPDSHCDFELGQDPRHCLRLDLRLYPLRTPTSTHIPPPILTFPCTNAHKVKRVNVSLGESIRVKLGFQNAYLRI
jgi:hypothetical protein